jgi:hypothetical protein
MGSRILDQAECTAFRQNLKEEIWHQVHSATGCALKKMLGLCLREPSYAEFMPAREGNGLAASNTTCGKSRYRKSSIEDANKV